MLLQEDCCSTWQLATLAGSGHLLAEAARKLLAWRSQTCPSRAKDPAEALSHSCGLFDAAWAQLTEERGSGDAQGGAEQDLVGSFFLA